MKKIFALFLTLICLLSLASCNIIPAEDKGADLTSVHGWFDPDDHGEIIFRGQRYCDTFASGELIFNNPMEGIAYITSEDITDDVEAEKVGAVVHFNADQEIPDILMMSTEDYMGDENYNELLYPLNTYFCKKEEWSTFGQKLRTEAFNSLYVACYETVDSEYLINKYELLDDDTTAAIKRTVKQDTDDWLDTSKIASGDFEVFVAYKCDKYMLVDPRTSQYTIYRVDGEYYIGSTYSYCSKRVSEEDKPLIEAMMDKYASTVDAFTAYYKKLIEISRKSPYDDDELFGDEI